MNTIVTIDKTTKQSSKVQIPDAFDFARKIEELSKGGTILFYGRNTIGGASAIIEV